MSEVWRGYWNVTVLELYEWEFNLNCSRNIWFQWNFNRHCAIKVTKGNIHFERINFQYIPSYNSNWQDDLSSVWVGTYLNVNWFPAGQQLTAAQSADFQPIGDWVYMVLTNQRWGYSCYLWRGDMEDWCGIMLSLQCHGY